MTDAPKCHHIQSQSWFQRIFSKSLDALETLFSSSSPNFRRVPPGSEFKGYQDYTVQELLIRPHNIRYRLARLGKKTPTGEYLRGKLPEAVLKMGHFGSTLKSYLLYQYHHCHVTQPKLLKMMEDWGIDLSSGQLNRILVEDKEQYHGEKQEILQVGLSVSTYINTVEGVGIPLPVSKRLVAS